MRRSGVAVLLLSLVATVVAQSDGDDDSSFVITSMNSGRSRGSGSRGSGSSSGRLTSSGNGGRRDTSSGSSQFPDFVRIEVEIQRLDNQRGILSNGKKCDFTRSCDPRLMAYIDTSRPLSPWPGSVPEKRWPIIFEASNTNSPTIGKSLNVDICGGSVNKVNARVSAHDVDTLSANDEINKFECLFDVDPRDIAPDASSAQWGPSTECRSAAQAGKIRLFARERAYQIPSTSCRASATA